MGSGKCWNRIIMICPANVLSKNEASTTFQTNQQKKLNNSVFRYACFHLALLFMTLSRKNKNNWPSWHFCLIISCVIYTFPSLRTCVHNIVHTLRAYYRFQTVFRNGRRNVYVICLNLLKTNIQTEFRLLQLRSVSTLTGSIRRTERIGIIYQPCSVPKTEDGKLVSRTTPFFLFYFFLHIRRHDKLHTTASFCFCATSANSISVSWRWETCKVGVSSNL